MTPLPDFDPGFSTPAMVEIWSARTTIRRFCEVEAALAAACAEASVIPESAARAIEAACGRLDVDPRALFAEGWTAGTPILALTDRLRQMLAKGDAAHVHFGATSQDIIDTARMLQIRDALGELSGLLAVTAGALAERIERHPHDWVLGRTLLRGALPMRFAYRLARWLDPVLELRDAIASRQSALPVQLGGPVGDRSSFGAAGGPIAAALAKRLGLSVPPLPWHTDRRAVVSSVSLATQAAAVAETIAADLLLLSQEEIGEIRLPSGGSSSMPHKKNAIHAVRAIAAARAAQGVASIVVSAPPHELERAAGSWHAEWFAVPLVFHTAGASLEALGATVARMELDAERATRRLEGIALPDPTEADRLAANVLARYTASRKT